MCRPLTSPGDRKWPLRPLGPEVPAAKLPLPISSGFRPGPALTVGERPPNEAARRNYLTCPFARWCGRALSSSWKLPPRGARRTGPGGGVRAEQSPSFPGEGSASPPSSLLRGGTRGGRGGEGAEAEVGGASRPTPPPEQRVPAAAPCRSPQPRRRRRGRRFRGNGTRDFLELAAFPGIELAATFEKLVGATWAQAARVGHMSLSLATSLGLLKRTGSGLGRSVARLALTPETGVLVVGFFLFFF